MTDVGTTPRKPLTSTQRLKLFEAHGGRCCLCGRLIRAGEPWIDEHLRALGLGGQNDWDNRAPAHVACANEKTHGKDGDLARIAKAKRQKMRHLGIEANRKAIANRGFTKAPPQRRATTPISKPAAWRGNFGETDV